MKYDWKNVQKAVAGLGIMDAKVEASIARATALMALEAERVAKQQIKGSHRPGTKTPSNVGQPPTNITGNLRRSIKGDVQRQGFASYVAIIGPTAIYGRAVELGHPNWGSGVKYPYMASAAKELLASNRLTIIYRKAIESAIR